MAITCGCGTAASNHAGFGGHGQTATTVEDFTNTNTATEWTVGKVSDRRTTVDVAEQTFNPSATLRKRTKFDVLGRAAETVDDLDGTDPVTTTYAYDAQGSLDRVTVDGVEVASMAYDVLGRRTNLTDASLGAWSFEHDALSRPTLTTDAKSQKTKYAYDALDRLKERRDCHAGCTPLVTNTWRWDAANGTGELSSRTNGAFTQTYTYRASDGKPDNVATSVNVAGVLTASYTRVLGYDAQARPSTVDHNGAVTYTYGYGARGHRTGVNQGHPPSGASGVNQARQSRTPTFGGVNQGHPPSAAQTRAPRAGIGTHTAIMGPWCTSGSDADLAGF
ncbi:MAG: RHS repeat protein [Gammaproteobacteria bacterium]|nr:RHS repeat protein [Gammaproteobacteria bacterium]MYK48047.1 RHS repeat protein [Gammaproteobacteria bacterium]